MPERLSQPTVNISSDERGRFPYLGDGDVVEIGIEGLGEQRQVFVQRR